MFELIAACGLDCAKCEAYIATQANDEAALAAVAEKWVTQYNYPGFTAALVRCDGCMAEGQKIGHCMECQIRLCAVERGLANCAVCSDFGCEKLTAFLVQVPPARGNLEALRKAI